MLGGLNIQAAATAAATNAATAAAGGGIPTWGWWAIAIGLATAALSPFVALLGSAAVILTTFAVAGAGTLMLLSALGLGFAAIGAGILLLGGGGGVGAAAALATTTTQLQNAQASLQEFDAAYKGHLTILQQQQREQLVESVAKAQDKYNEALARSQGPVGVLLGQLGAMKDAWAVQAAPLALIITTFAERALPAIQQLGSTIMTWFGERLPGVLAAMGKAFTDLGPSFTAFGNFLGKFFDQMGSMTSIGSGGNILTLGVVFENFARLAMGALQGLLTVLGQLSQWFMERLPAYGPIVQQTFGLLGQIILGVASIWGKFADWLVSNWPAIMALVQSATASIVDQWSRWSVILGPIIQGAMPEFAAAIKLISQHMGALIPILVLALAAIVVIGPGLMVLVGVSLSVIDAIQRIAFAFAAMRLGVNSDLIAFAVAVSNWENAVILSVRNVISALDQIPGVNIALPDFVSSGNVAVNTQRGFGGQQQ